MRENSIPATACPSLPVTQVCTKDARGRLRGFVTHGLAVERHHFAFRSDDLIVVWQAVQAGLGIRFASEHMIRSAPAVIPVLPKLRIKTFPVWLAVHREIRTSKRIQAVYDFLSDALPAAI